MDTTEHYNINTYQLWQIIPIAILLGPSVTLVIIVSTCTCLIAKLCSFTSVRKLSGNIMCKVVKIAYGDKVAKVDPDSNIYKLGELFVKPQALAYPFAVASSICY